MTSILLLCLTGCLLLVFPLMLQPLSLGLSIMGCTLLMCVCSAMLLPSWYAYVLFLIYVGGLLVMFAYVAALMPNLSFSKNTSLAMLYSALFFISGGMIYYLIVLDLSNLDFLYEQGGMKESASQGLSMVSPSLISIYISLGIILLLNLIVVVKLCYSRQAAPLRPFSVEKSGGGVEVYEK